MNTKVYVSFCVDLPRYVEAPRRRGSDRPDPQLAQGSAAKNKCTEDGAKRPTDRRTDRYTDRRTDEQTHRQTRRHTNTQADTQRHRQTGAQTHRQTDEQTHRPTDKQADRQTNGQAGKRARCLNDLKADARHRAHKCFQVATQSQLPTTSLRRRA